MDKIWNESSKMNRFMVMGVIISLILFSATFYFYNEVSVSRDSDAKARVEEVSKQYQSSVINQINGDISTLVGVASVITPSDLQNENVLLDYFQDVVHQNGFLRMSFTRMDGYAFMVDQEGHKSYNIDLREREDIQQALAGEVNLSAAIKDNVTSEYINTYAVPIYQDGQRVGAITAVHKAERFYDLLMSEIFGGAGETILIDRNGSVVVQVSDEETSVLRLKERMDNQKELKALLESVKQQKTDVFNVLIDGKDYLISSVPLGMNDWSIVTLVPEDYFVSGYERLVAIFTLVSFVIIVIFIVLFLLLKKTMKTSRESIVKLAYHDSLTGMYNRNRFMDIVSEKIVRGHAFVFVLLDIAHFKFINETYGYEGGNGLLRHIAHVLAMHTLKEEVCFRDSADCFGMLLHFKGKQELEKRLDNITREIAQYSLDSNENYNIVCNCGIKIVDSNLKNGYDIDMIFDRATLALEEAKGYHKNTYVYFEERMEERSHKRFKIENNMRSALENHEFQMYLQPKISIESGKVIGAEALARWVVDGEVQYYPDEFIPIFENNGFICELDLYMLEEVCICLKTGIEKGLDMIPISINQSKVLFYRTNYLDSLKEILNCYKVDPSLIIIEVTETVTMENMSGVKDIIKGLHDLGFKVSMDDFGSGYSSLNVLQKLDIDELKLDRVFLMNSEYTFKQRKVIESIVRLAKELNISTVSEGVETKEQLAFLKAISCDIAQGYYYSKPVFYRVLIDEIYTEDKWKH